MEYYNRELVINLGIEYIRNKVSFYQNLEDDEFAIVSIQLDDAWELDIKVYTETNQPQLYKIHVDCNGQVRLIS